MINFRELQIFKCGKALSLDVTLEHLDVFPNAYISELIIDTGDTFIETGPSNTPIFTKTYPVGTTTIVEEISKDGLIVNLNKEILFVYIVVNGLPADYDECVYGPKMGLKSVVNLYPYYSIIMKSISSLSGSCNDNTGFINDMLLFKAFEYANITCSYTQVIDLWNRFFDKTKPTTTKGCGCNG